MTKIINEYDNGRSHKLFLDAILSSAPSIYSDWNVPSLVLAYYVSHQLSISTSESSWYDFTGTFGCLNGFPFVAFLGTAGEFSSSSSEESS